MKRWRVYKTLLSYFETTCTLLQGMYPTHRACMKQNCIESCVCQCTDLVQSRCPGIHARLAQTGVANLINPFAGGADQAL
jgi:hypothetical protein|eukprot:COSAG02_NODE_1811_length_10794_cov_9.516784_10_plen_80_part_00